MTKRRVELALPVGRPFHTGSLLAYLRAREIAGVEEVGDRLYRRSLRREGASGELSVDFTEAARSGYVSVSCSAELGLDADSLAGIAANLVDADAPVGAIADRLGDDPMVGPLVRQYPGIRIPGTVEPFELSVRAILGQQVSVAAARTLAGRVAVRWGTELARPTEGISRAFPDAALLAEAPLEQIGLSRTRAQAVRGLATAVAGGDLDLRPGQADPKAAEGALLALDGIGPWTASYISLRGLRHRDSIPVGDLGLRQVLQCRGAREVVRRAEGWRPWRGYAAVHLWSTFLSFR